MSRNRILLVDDDEELAYLLRDFLTREGFDVVLAFNADDALALVRDGSYDAAVFDVMMPGRSGLDILRELRRESVLPVLLLTALTEDIDRILGLELGADDYIPKPCNPRELAARLRAVLRRSHTESTEALTDLHNGPIYLRASSRSVSINGKSIVLTATEFDLLVLLLRETGRVVSKERISQAVLGRARGPFDRSIDVHVSNLRRKLGDAPDGASPITTIHRSGYLLRHLGDSA
ncbi:MAG: response regulator transcription factor [Rhodanobacter sp.]|nr:response regulator transcription factor [Rhodanobacter sp.]